jgi:hypothetical protein
MRRGMSRVVNGPAQTNGGCSRAQRWHVPTTSRRTCAYGGNYCR